MYVQELEEEEEVITGAGGGGGGGGDGGGLEGGGGSTNDNQAPFAHATLVGVFKATAPTHSAVAPAMSALAADSNDIA